jgi:hypothetical protein
MDTRSSCPIGRNGLKIIHNLLRLSSIGEGGERVAQVLPGHAQFVHRDARSDPILMELLNAGNAVHAL